jgi:hypothetical protein
MASAINRSVPLLGLSLPSPWAAPPSLVVVQYSNDNIGTREEEEIILGDNNRVMISGGDAIATIHGGDPGVANDHRTHISIGPGHRLKPWVGFKSLALALKTIMME